MTRYDPFAGLPGGFSDIDGTVSFYLRVRSYLGPQSRVLDLGAGRAAWYEDDPVPARRWVQDLRPDVAELVAADIDEAVLQNHSATRCVLLDSPRLPFSDGEFDVVISDFVLEHIKDPTAFAAEVDRVLRPGGVFCARTPHRLHYVALMARLAPRRLHGGLLSVSQPERKPKDVFAAFYKMNDRRTLSRLFPGWDLRIIQFRGDPAYFFGSKTAFGILSVVHAIAPWPIVGTLMIFACKPAASDG